jgi:hypothetical protein
MVSAVALLLAEAIRAGVSIKAIMDDASANGHVSDEQWRLVRDAVKQANLEWENA